MLAPLLAVTMLLAGCTAPDGHEESRASALARYHRQEISWSACEERPGVECGRVTVPLDHADPAGATVQMPVYRVRARGQEPRGAVVLLPGEAGASGGDLFGPATFTFHELGTSHDLVSYDPRGILGTPALRCEENDVRTARLALDATPDSLEEEDALVGAWRRYARGCSEAGRESLTGSGSAHLVRDLDILRAAMREKTISFYGASYGALVAREYLRTFPERAGRVVLDAPRAGSRPGEEAAVQQGVAAAEAMFDEALATCFANPFLPCPLGGSVPEARARVQEMLHELDEEPHDLGRGGILTREHAVGAVWDAMAAGPAGWTDVVRALGRASGGDWGELADQARDSLARRTADAAVAARCADRGPSTGQLDEIRQRAAELAGRSPLFGETLAWRSIECVDWPVGPGLTSKTRSDPAVARGVALVVVSVGDPRTPPGLPGATARLLGNAPVLTYTGAEHGAYYSSPCVRYVVNDFLTAGVIPVNLTCGDLPLRRDWRQRGCVGACTVVPAARISPVGPSGPNVLPWHRAEERTVRS